ncbi:hypothetical protein BN137_2546 [Cronobacter condimenti 1330]|uniref:Uncharacterized protein n=1 Tax=Cronobacter condimenti 1330 TaxID=1073999 RepID=K8ABP1_9ENTR|nr:hypothetical protein BN137_2546 [Cronobacter condimenti 1330]
MQKNRHYQGFLSRGNMAVRCALIHLFLHTMQATSPATLWANKFWFTPSLVGFAKSGI